MRAAIQRVPDSQDPCLYSDSKWCVDIFSNLRLCNHRGWMVQGKKPVRHHDVWEDIYQMCQAKTSRISMTHVYGHNRLVYNEEADTLAKAGAAMSKVHRPSRVKNMPQGSPVSTRRKQTRGRGVKKQVAVQVSDGSTDSDRPAHIRHRRREMRNAPLGIPDPELD